MKNPLIKGELATTAIYMEDRIVNAIIKFFFGGAFFAILVLAGLVYTLYNSLWQLQ